MEHPGNCSALCPVSTTLLQNVWNDLDRGKPQGAQRIILFRFGCCETGSSTGKCFAV